MFLAHRQLASILWLLHRGLPSLFTSSLAEISRAHC